MSKIRAQEKQMKKVACLKKERRKDKGGKCEATTLVSMGMFDAPILSQATQDVCKPLTTVRQVPVGGVIMYHEE